jgi:TolB-like protein/class 3 adenylate cyclase/tetratricopeptide (TPR) repeat protein
VSETRKLAAILVSDVVGYSRLTGADEDRILARLRTLRSDLIDPTIAVHHGRIVKRTGDGSIVEFRSVVDAVNLAIEVQRAMVERNAEVAADKRIEFRIGIHLGDVVEESDGDLMGDSVNIAARIEGIAEPGTICLSEDAYRQVKGRLDLAVRDLGPIQLKNIAEPIRVYSLEIGAPAHAKPAPSPTSEKTTPPRLSLVVLPFANIGGDPSHEHFVDGITESLTTDLSRIRGALVIARNTAFTYDGKPLDAKMIGRELNVRYVLEGSVQRAGDRMRVNVQLVDAETGNHLWAERFDKPLGDLFDTQDEIVSRLSNVVTAQVTAAEARRAKRAPNPDATDFFLQGRALWDKGITAANLAESRGLFQRALALNPADVRARVALANVDIADAVSFSPDDRVARFAAAETVLSEALCLDPENAVVHLCLGIVQINTNRAAQGIRECERALELNRNLVNAQGHIGYAKILLGKADDTEAHVLEALRLSPSDVHVYLWCMFAGAAKLYLGNEENSIPWLRRSIEVNRNFAYSHFLLATVFARLGRLQEARSEAQAGLALNPALTVSRARAAWTAMSNDPTYLAQLESVFEGLRKAGIPEQ